MTGPALRGDSTIHDCVRWAQSHVDQQWLAVWKTHIDKVTRVYELEGEPAYGLYARRLFVPIRDALTDSGVLCRPALPGTFELSEERWGRLTCRERRLWSVLRRRQGGSLGAMVTCFFHDHTRLRVPRAPILFAIESADHEVIRRLALNGLRDPATAHPT